MSRFTLTVVLGYIACNDRRGEMEGKHFKSTKMTVHDENKANPYSLVRSLN